ncbi:hypothetical protein ZEAMMB73_Zm00001d013959 [Zea mays]|uniref:Uncharacterized protein n=1 Tax=Zea mays TaxID=4577 RepID=A0A1D6GNT5_MAIZE|nr:hypothetical protein ZEAMMB73_Zm00001d013959 [Zea mays]
MQGVSSMWCHATGCQRPGKVVWMSCSCLPLQGCSDSPSSLGSLDTPTRRCFLVFASLSLYHSSTYQISNAEFTFSPWTPFPTKRLLPRILDPNPRRSAS